jgi:electron transfer flavoprotein alpha subunit
VLIGNNLAAQAAALLRYGIDHLYLYEHPELEHFRIEPYTAVFEDFINRATPSVVLVGGTTIGRSLAPRTAARFRTGLTADCTSLDIQTTTDLDQIRPAFGGNIMAHIRTPRHRPQFATVRYKIFSAPSPVAAPTGVVVPVTPLPAMLKSRIEVLASHRKEPVKAIEDADVIIVAGHGLQRAERVAWLEQIAAKLDRKSVV